MNSSFIHYLSLPQKKFANSIGVIKKICMVFRVEYFYFLVLFFSVVFWLTSSVVRLISVDSLFIFYPSEYQLLIPHAYQPAFSGVLIGTFSNTHGTLERSVTS